MENKLKPCPFCGSDKVRMVKSDRVVRDDEDSVVTTSARYKIYCAWCSCETGFRFYEEGARRAWNRRPENEVATD